MSPELSTLKPIARFAAAKAMFGRFRRMHLVGIGGAGMSGIAEILHNLGYTVTGSDNTPSDVTTYLERLGVTVFKGHAAAQASEADVVVISSAVSKDNPEVVEALNRGIPVIKRAEMLGELMRLKFSIGVAGSHGKTTTTSMLGRILRLGKYEPTLIIGGIVADLGTGAELGTGDYLVAEVDEYDRSIFAAFPSMAVVLNVEPDHLDCYDDIDDLRNAFLEYVNRVPFYGAAVVNAEDENLSLIKDKITRRFVTFGFSEEADFRAVDIRSEGLRSSYKVFRGQDLLGEVVVGVPGRHNVANSLAAVAAAVELDVPFEVITSALREFRGVGRRFEIVGEANGILVIDDYAHHPTEIEATLRAAREAYGRRTIVVFQPHLYSRTRDFMNEFAQALSLADQCILTDIYPAREEPIEGITSERLCQVATEQGHDGFSYVGVKENAIDAVLKVARPGDVVMTVGAGSITHIRRQILEGLEKL